MEYRRKTTRGEVDALARDIWGRLADLHPKAAYLFGSLAGGWVDERSDIDLIVVMETDLPFFERWRPVAKRLDFPGRAVDLLVYTPEEWERKLRYPVGVTYIALTDGVPLHERAGPG